MKTIHRYASLLTCIASAISCEPVGTVVSSTSFPDVSFDDKEAGVGAKPNQGVDAGQHPGLTNDSSLNSDGLPPQQVDATDSGNVEPSIQNDADVASDADGQPNDVELPSPSDDAELGTGQGDSDIDSNDGSSDVDGDSDDTLSGQHGSACHLDTDCQTDFRCVRYSSSDATRLCRQTCGNQSDCNALGAGSHCIFIFDTFGVCTVTCDRVTEAPCASSGMKCLLHEDDEGSMGTVCALTLGEGTHNASCTELGDCAPGHHCTTENVNVNVNVNVNETKICLRACVFGEIESTCPDNGRCMPYSNGVTINDIEYGYCYP